MNSVAEISRDVSLHSEVPELHSAIFRFADCPLVSPTLIADAIESDNHAGAILSSLTVEKHYSVLFVVDQCEDFLDLGFSRRPAPVERNIEVAQAGGFCVCLFYQCAFVVIAEVYDGSDAEFGEFFEAFLARLSAAIEFFVYASEPGQCFSRLLVLDAGVLRARHVT